MSRTSRSGFVGFLLLATTNQAAAGKVYDVASDEPVTQRMLLRATAESLGFPQTQRRVPFPLAYALAAVTEIGARLLCRTAPFNRVMITFMHVDQVIDISRIRDDLGWKPQVRFEEGIHRFGEWYRSSIQGSGSRIQEQQPCVT